MARSYFEGEVTPVLDQYPDVLTVRQVMEILQLGRDVVYGLLKKGEIPSSRAGKCIRVRKQDLIDYCTPKNDGEKERKTNEHE